MVLIVLLVVAIALITIDFRDGGDSSAHGIGGRLFGPVERVTGDVTGFFRGATSGGEVASLQKQNDELRAELAQAQTSNANAGQLARLLHLTGAKYKVVTGTVIAAGGDYADTVTINVGSAAGVAANETVLNGDGLVGTVTSVTSGTATVQLASDAGATVGVRMAGNGQIGALSGTAKLDDRQRRAAAHPVLRERRAPARPGTRHLRLGRRPPVRARRSRSASCPP